MFCVVQSLFFFGLYQLPNLTPRFFEKLAAHIAYAMYHVSEKGKLKAERLGDWRGEIRVWCEQLLLSRSRSWCCAALPGASQPVCAICCDEPGSAAFFLSVPMLSNGTDHTGCEAPAIACDLQRSFRLLV